MELELALLRNSRPEEERMTVDEASNYLETQVSCSSEGPPDERPSQSTLPNWTATKSGSLHSTYI